MGGPLSELDAKGNGRLKHLQLNTAVVAANQTTALLSCARFLVYQLCNLTTVINSTVFKVQYCLLLS